jgi:hypothetical protein
MPMYVNYLNCKICGCNSVHIYIEGEHVDEGSEEQDVNVYFTEICTGCVILGKETGFHFKTQESHWDNFKRNAHSLKHYLLCN